MASDFGAFHVRHVGGCIFGDGIGRVFPDITVRDRKGPYAAFFRNGFALGFATTDFYADLLGEFQLDCWRFCGLWVCKGGGRDENCASDHNCKSGFKHGGFFLGLDLS